MSGYSATDIIEHYFLHLNRNIKILKLVVMTCLVMLSKYVFRPINYSLPTFILSIAPVDKVVREGSIILLTNDCSMY